MTPGARLAKSPIWSAAWRLRPAICSMNVSPCASAVGLTGEGCTGAAGAGGVLRGAPPGSPSKAPGVKPGDTVNEPFGYNAERWAAVAAAAEPATCGCGSPRRHADAATAASASAYAPASLASPEPSADMRTVGPER